MKIIIVISHLFRSMMLGVNDSKPAKKKPGRKPKKKRGGKKKKKKQEDTEEEEEDDDMTEEEPPAEEEKKEDKTQLAISRLPPEKPITDVRNLHF